MNTGSAMLMGDLKRVDKSAYGTILGFRAHSNPYFHVHNTREGGPITGGSLRLTDGQCL